MLWGYLNDAAKDDPDVRDVSAQTSTKWPGGYALARGLAENFGHEGHWGVRIT